MTEPQIHLFKDDGIIPNHPTLPLVYYHNAVELNGTDNAAVFERLFYNNNWEGSWRNGVYPFPHYHAAAHEVLGVTVAQDKFVWGVAMELLQRYSRGA